MSERLPVFFRYRLAWHLVFWLVVFFMYWLTFASYMDRYYQEFISNLILLPVRMIGTYTLIYLVLPVLTDKKKFTAFVFFLLLHFFLYGFLLYASMYIANPFPNFYDFSKLPFFNPNKMVAKSITDYAIPAMGAAIVIFKKWYLDELKNKKLAAEKMAAELSFLKAQIHPHFLFNTLNNLYALALIKSDKTPDIVLKLSDLMDYMIYKSNDEFVPLSKELEILNSYVELEKMRYNERLDIVYEVKGDAIAYQIAPLVLLPFVENSFKHGASKDRANPVVHIKIEINPVHLNLKVVNSLTVEKKNGNSENEGIGLANVKRRLELIYPGQFELYIQPGFREFKVDLKIFWKK